MKNTFKEKQKFTQWGLWALLGGIGLLFAFGIYKQLILGEPFGNNPMPDGVLIIFSIFFFSLIALFRIIRLQTKVDQNGISISFFPILKKQISWKEIKSAKIVHYGFIGGWGIRMWTKYGTAYNIKGKHRVGDRACKWKEIPNRNSKRG